MWPGSSQRLPLDAASLSPAIHSSSAKSTPSLAQLALLYAITVNREHVGQSGRLTPTLRCYLTSWALLHLQVPTFADD